MTPSHRVAARAFTLFDVLTVVAVVALLVSIALPILAKMKEPARRAMCVDNLHRLMEGVLSYANEYEGKGPIRGWFTYTVTETAHEAYGTGGHIKVPINLGQLYPKWIGGQHDRLYCPSTYATIRDHPAGWKSAFDPAQPWTLGSYNYGTILPHRAARSPIFSGTNPFPPEVWSWQFSQWVQNVWQPRNPGKTFVIPDSPALAFDMWIGGLKPVHGPGVNVLYTDGHVRYHDIGGITVNSGNQTTQYDIWHKVSLRQ